jgi:chorismate dehydratase
MKPRIGSISFINSFPVDYALTRNVIPHEYSIHTGVPSKINRMIELRTLDIAPVSSLFYAQNAGDLLTIPQFSISSESGVKSVLLFSKKPIQLLQGARIAVTSQARSTPGLLKLLLSDRFKIEANLHPRDLEYSQLDDSPFDAQLLIGDDALIAARHRQPHHHMMDLAEEWRIWTGLPFVFAFWVVRKNYFETHADDCFLFQDKLTESRQWSSAHMDDVIKAASKITGHPADLLLRYYRELRFDYDATLKKGFFRFIELLQSHGFEADPNHFLSTEEVNSAKLKN